MRRPTFASSGSSSTSVVSAALAAAIFGWPVPSSAFIDFDASTTRITAASLSGAGCAWACAPAGASSRRSIPRAPAARRHRRIRSRGYPRPPTPGVTMATTRGAGPPQRAARHRTGNRRIGHDRAGMRTSLAALAVVGALLALPGRRARRAPQHRHLRPGGLDLRRPAVRLDRDLPDPRHRALGHRVRARHEPHRPRPADRARHLPGHPRLLRAPLVRGLRRRARQVLPAHAHPVPARRRRLPPALAVRQDDLALERGEPPEPADRRPSRDGGRLLQDRQGRLPPLHGPRRGGRRPLQPRRLGQALQVRPRLRPAAVGPAQLRRRDPPPRHHDPPHARPGQGRRVADGDRRARALRDARRQRHLALRRAARRALAELHVQARRRPPGPHQARVHLQLARGAAPALGLGAARRGRRAAAELLRARAAPAPRPARPARPPPATGAAWSGARTTAAATAACSPPCAARRRGGCAARS